MPQSSRLSRQIPQGTTCTRVVCLAVAAFLLTLPIAAVVVLIIVLGIVLSPFSIAFVICCIPALPQLIGAPLLQVAVALLCMLWFSVYLFCVVGWPYIVVFWLGPWSPTAVAIGHCTSIIVLIGTVYIIASLVRRKDADLRNADLQIRSSEIAVLESSRLWYIYLISILLDWYQYSALSFSTPDIKLPPSVQDFLNIFFALGRFALPFLPQEVTLLVAFVAANTMMCAGPMFFLLLSAGPIFRTLVTSWIHPARTVLIQPFKTRRGQLLLELCCPCRSVVRYSRNLRQSISKRRWREAAHLLKNKYPHMGGTLVHILDAADVKKWQKEISMSLVMFTSLLVGVVSANLRVMACFEKADTDGHINMFLAADPNMQCWTPTHSVLALTAGSFLTAFLPVGLLMQLLLEQYGVKTHRWFTMVERPLKLLTVGVAIQCEALKWTHVRLAVASASAAGIAVTCHSLWSCNNAGLNRLRQLAWWSATINSLSSWIHFEMSDAAGYIGIACFVVGHMILAVVAFSDVGADHLFTKAFPMRRLRRFTRLLILLVIAVSASIAGVLPQLLAVNTGAYLEDDLNVSLISDSYTVITDSCAIFVRTTNCSGCDETPAGSPSWFAEGKARGRIRIWSPGTFDQNLSEADIVILGTDLQACELWLLVPHSGTFSITCKGECTLHANGVFAGNLAICS